MRRFLHNTHKNLEIEDNDLGEELWKEIDMVLNVAVTTDFYGRYDVALNINVLGAKHVLKIAKKCAKIEMRLHVSTAYVAGVKEGLILEKPFHMSETLEGGTDLDVVEELKLVEERKRELRMDDVKKNAEKTAMKDLGLQRYVL